MPKRSRWKKIIKLKDETNKRERNKKIAKNKWGK